MNRRSRAIANVPSLPSGKAAGAPPPAAGQASGATESRRTSGAGQSDGADWARAFNGLVLGALAREAASLRLEGCQGAAQVVSARGEELRLQAPAQWALGRDGSGRAGLTATLRAQVHGVPVRLTGRLRRGTAEGLWTLGGVHGELDDCQATSRANLEPGLATLRSSAGPPWAVGVTDLSPRSLGA